MSTVAVFIALGGSSYAALQIDSADIANNSVRGVDVRNRIAQRARRQAQRAWRQEHPRVATRSRAAGSGRRSPHRDERRGSAAQVPDRHVPDRGCLRRDDGTPAGLVRRRRHRMREHGVPAGPGRRLPTHGELRSALSAVQLAPGGELTSEVYPSTATPGSSTSCTSPTRSAAWPSRRTAARAARPSAASPTRQLRTDARQLQHGRKEMSSLSAHLRQTEDHSRLRFHPAAPSAAATGSQAR